MIKLAWAVTCLVVWAGVSQVSVGVRLENGRYEDVVLAVDPAMGTDVISITDLEKKVKTLLQATSDSLHAATEGRLSLGSVRVVLPQTWNAPDDLLEDPVEGVSWGSADIRLEEPEKDYRGNYVSHTPHTLQPGQCGVPGRHITIHTTLLDADYAEANYGSQGAVMAHEWAHFRWGVMEEHGFPGDGVFPVHYSRGGQDELPTSCFAGDLEGKYETEKGEACDPGAASPACYFLPSGSSTNGSLMYLTLCPTAISARGTPTTRGRPHLRMFTVGVGLFGKYLRRTTISHRQADLTQLQRKWQSLSTSLKHQGFSCCSILPFLRRARPS